MNPHTNPDLALAMLDIAAGKLWPYMQLSRSAWGARWHPDAWRVVQTRLQAGRRPRQLAHGYGRPWALNNLARDAVRDLVNAHADAVAYTNPNLL